MYQVHLNQLKWESVPKLVPGGPRRIACQSPARCEYLFAKIMAEKPGLVGISWCLTGYSSSNLVNGPACMRAGGGRVTGV